MAIIKTISFHLVAPEAQSVTVTGSFNNWDREGRRMRRRKDGVWWINLRLGPGTYEYKFVIDGSNWQEDSANPARVVNQHGTYNSVREVS